MEIHIISNGVMTVEELTRKMLTIHENVDYLHIREKTKTVAEINELVSNLLHHGVDRNKIVINDRLDVVLLQNLINLHLPGHSFPIETVKKYAPSLRVGKSVHSLNEAIESEEAGADYLLFGHIFSTDSKANLPPRGVKQLEEICKSVKIPVIAIGGIVPETIKHITNINIGGIAMMSHILASEQPAEALRTIKERLVEEEQDGESL
ncbi:thiamine phosphate synthase [Metabacillus malikii]|uniref:Thiazole tautomerase (Transcriptional regulator TenI) n=1 Tax=Metabacillus malikii TaxID=1504265 RepID=A0ABT9ZHE9_9BACI|nr:thiamine phosphate synthase [Metabacillus malikii]MDQ0230630.1 thiazole tautomerase (transcriptional regulator TenI) [Metabacillus malikii]